MTAGRAVQSRRRTSISTASGQSRRGPRDVQRQRFEDWVMTQRLPGASEAEWAWDAWRAGQYDLREEHQRRITDALAAVEHEVLQAALFCLHARCVASVREGQLGWTLAKEIARRTTERLADSMAALPNRNRTRERKTDGAWSR